jgi:YVTN family beta-propeller protein
MAGVVGVVVGVSLSTSPAAGVVTTSPGYSVSTVGAFNAPKGIAVTPDGKHLYVANSLNQTVSVIDTATHDLVHTIIDPSLSTPTGVAVSPDGKSVYVSNQGSGTVSKISTATEKVVATIGTTNINAHPTGVAITPDGKTAFVTEGGLDVVTVIKLATSTVTGTISVGNDPEGIAITPDGTKALVTDYGDLLHPGTSVSVIDVANGTVSSTITDAVKLQSPLGIAISPDGSTAYAANRGQITSVGSSVAVIDVATNTVTSDVTVAGAPVGVAVTPNGAKVYAITDVDEQTVSVIDTATKAVTSVDMGSHPFSYMRGVVAAPDGTTVYVTGAPGEDIDTGTDPDLGYGNLVAAIDTGTQIVTGLVPTIGTDPSSIALSPDNRTAYVLARGGLVSVMDTASDVVTKDIRLTSGEALAESPDGKWVYVTAHTVPTGTVAVIDTSTESVVATIPVGSNPSGVAFSPDGSRAYVANTFDATVSVIDTATKTAINTINVQPTFSFGGDPEGVTVSHDGKKVYVSNGAVITTADGSVSGPFGVDTHQVQATALSPSDKVAYEVASSSAVLQVDTATGHQTTFFPDNPSVSRWLTAVQLSPDGTKGYFVDQLNNTLLVVNLSTHKLTGTVVVGQAPTGLAVGTNGRAVYVANGTSNSVSAITLPRQLSRTPVPRIVGKAQVGRTLTVRPGTWGPGTVTLRYRWYAGGKPIAKATKKTLKLTKKQKGKKITVKVTGSEPGYSSVTKTSKPTASVKK